MFDQSAWTIPSQDRRGLEEETISRREVLKLEFKNIITIYP